MILVIDNYDSFVYNLARYFAKCEYITHVVRNDAISVAEIEALDVSHIIISPGPCTPNEAGVSLAVIEYFYTKMPILGVCLGHQAIGQFFGAKITKAKVPLHGQASQIFHNHKGVFTDIPQSLLVGRYHSLIVDKLPDDSPLEITALSGENEIMAVAHKNYPLIGVQFHPESILTEYGEQIINNFLNY